MSFRQAVVLLDAFHLSAAQIASNGDGYLQMVEVAARAADRTALQQYVDLIMRGAREGLAEEGIYPQPSSTTGPYVHASTGRPHG